MPRRRVHKVILFIAVVLLMNSIALFVYGDNSDVKTGRLKTNRPYISPTPGKIPIIASSLVVTGELPSLTMIKDFHDCGFDVLYQYNKVELYDSLMSLFKDSGVKLMPYAAPLQGPSKEACANFMRKYKDNPLVCGWEFKDEPRYADLDMLEGIFEEMTRVDPKHLIQMNLVGEPVKDFIGPNTPDMNAYLDTIQKRFAPGVWSYDFYPLKIVDNNGILIVEYDKFYSALEAFSKISKKTDRPFWAYCQGVGFSQGRMLRPVPKEEYLRFEAFSALAYGAQGIVYWTYTQCRDVPSINFKYLDGCINLKGKKTKVWKAAKKVNGEINRYNDVFLGCKLVDVVHTGKNHYKDTKMINGSFGPFKAFVSEQAGVMLSHLKNGDNDYVVIVNHDVEHKQLAGFRLQAGYTLESMTDNKVFGSLTDKAATVTINPGGYAIFKVIKN